MQAIVMGEFGPPEVLRPRAVAPPEPGPREVLVRVHATSVNAVDCRIRQGEGAVALPAILGCDVSGVVAAVGAGVEDFAAGDAVFYAPEPYTGGGSYAEYHVAPEAAVARKPRNLSHVEAAGLPMAAGTAWDALVARAGLVVGETVLVVGGDAVALFGVQIARAAGAEVFAVCPPALAGLAARLGAARTIDPAREHVADVLAAESADGLADVVLDTAGAMRLEQWVGVTKARGRIASTVAPAGGSGEAVLRNVTHHLVSAAPDRGRLDVLRVLAERGQVVPVVDRVMALREAAAAHRAAEAGGLLGKIVLQMT